jgi:hypothetical protein
MLRSQQFKKLSAMMGAAAFIVMAALSVGVAQNRQGTGTIISDPSATLGETATTTTPPPQPATPRATPPFTFTTPSGFATPH